MIHDDNHVIQLYNHIGINFYQFVYFSKKILQKNIFETKPNIYLRH